MYSYDKTVIPLIESKYTSFTSVEKRIADYFLSYPSHEDLSSKTLSQKLYISEASLSRFAKKCGFKGYREFVFAYCQNDHSNNQLDLLTKQVLTSYQKILEQTYELVNNTQMIRISKMFDEYDRVFVYGIGSSSIVAREFKIRFIRLGLDVDYLAESHSILTNTARLNSRSLVIGISISGKTIDILKGLTEAKNKGAKTILVTANDINKYFKDYDEIIRIGNIKNLTISDKISPQMPALVFIDILYAHYLHYNQDKKRSHLQDSLKLIDFEMELE